LRDGLRELIVIHAQYIRVLGVKQAGVVNHAANIDGWTGDFEAHHENSSTSQNYTFDFV